MNFNKVLVAATVLLLTPSLLFAQSLEDYETEIEAANSRIEAANSQLRDLQRQLRNIDGRMESLQSDLSRLRDAARGRDFEESANYWHSRHQRCQRVSFARREECRQDIQRDQARESRDQERAERNSNRVAEQLDELYQQRQRYRDRVAESEMQLVSLQNFRDNALQARDNAKIEAQQRAPAIESRIQEIGSELDRMNPIAGDEASRARMELLVERAELRVTRMGWDRTGEQKRTDSQKAAQDYGDAAELAGDLGDLDAMFRFLEIQVELKQ